MRKFFIIVAFILCFIMVGFCNYDAINFAFNESANPKYYFYVHLSEETEDLHYTKNGDGGIIALDKSELNLLDNFKIDKMYGKSVVVNGNNSYYNEIVESMNLQVIKEENFETFTTIYGYNQSLGDCVTINGQQVNVQIAKRGNVISIGYPILLGSY